MIDFFDKLFGGESGPAGLPGESSEHLDLVVGLGNPGAKYDRTRHNIGFMVLDQLAEKASLGFKSQRKCEADEARIDGTPHLKPKTYMNDSGRSVARAAKFYQTEADRIIILCDDISLPLGSVRIRRAGSAGGHNGLKSIASALGSDQYPRLRIGVGANNQGDLSKHVLGRFREEERSALDQGIEKAIEALHSCLHEGLDAAMSRHNQRGQGRQA